MQFNATKLEIEPLVKNRIMSTSKIEIENVFYARIPEDKNSIQNVTFEK